MQKNAKIFERWGLNVETLKIASREKRMHATKFFYGCNAIITADLTHGTILGALRSNVETFLVFAFILHEDVAKISKKVAGLMAINGRGPGKMPRRAVGCRPLF